MKLASKAVLLGALLLPMAAAPASAQSWKWDLSLGGGYAWYRAFLDSDNAPLADGSEVKFGSSPFFGGQLTFWPSSRFGLRINGTYADTDVEQKFGDDVVGDIDSGTLLESVNLWSGTADLLFRFARPDDEYDGLEILPYGALGLGLKWMNGADDLETCVDTEENESFNCNTFTVNTQRFALAESNNLMGLIGLGADWRFSRGFALRTEIGDRIWDARVHPLGVGNTTTDTDISDDIHELYGQVGLTFLFGVARPAVVAVAPPPPAPAPTPVPEVRRESISVCVIDPTAPGGIRMQTATLIEGRDTVVTVGGSDRPFRESVGNVMVASNADWYVRGQPLSMTVGTQNVEFATYGSARTVEASDISFLGTVNGVPVYADKDEVADVIGELNDLNRAQRGTDLGKILGEHKDLREELEDVKVLYVPLYSTGCVFQGVQRQEEVRKGGK
jgi:hypothetical protein